MRDAVLFAPDGLGTPLLFGQWRRKAPQAPIQSYAVLLNRDLTASAYFRALWTRAFPTRRPMPVDPIAQPDGKGTDRFWDVFS